MYENNNCNFNSNCLPVLPPGPFMIDSSKYIGGDGGTEFDDKLWWRYKKLTGVKLCCLGLFDAIQMKYGNDWAPIHGVHDVCSNHGNCKWKEFSLDSDERIINVTITYGIHPQVNTIIHTIAMSTNKRSLDSCGTDQPDSNGKTVTLTGHSLEYISGKTGCLMDGLTFHWSHL